MSSHEDIVRRAYATLAAGDVDSFFELVHADLEFTSLIQESEGGTYRGNEGVRQYLDSMLSILPDWRPTVEHTEPFPAGVLVKARVSATGPGSGAAVEQAMWQVGFFQGDLIREWRFFRTEKEARHYAATDPLGLTIRGFEIINAGDIDALLTVVDPDVELRPALVGGMERTIYRGHAGYRAWFEEMYAMYDHVVFRDLRVRRLDASRTLTLYTANARARGSGIELNAPWAVMGRFRNGLLVEQTAYRDQDEALRATKPD